MRRRFVIVVLLVAVTNLALLFAAGFGAVGYGTDALPDNIATIAQTILRRVTEVLLIPAAWLYEPDKDTSVIAGGSVIVANSILWGVVIAAIWTYAQRRKDAAF